MTTRIQTDIKRLRQDFPDLIIKEFGDNTIHIEIPEFLLTKWWKPPVTRLLLVVQRDFPQSRPSFYIGDEVRRPDGNPPDGSGGPKTIDNKQWRSLCWNWQWDPAKETLWRLVKAIKQRFYEQR